jgi:hypothetical protein
VQCSLRYDAPNELLAGGLVTEEFTVAVVSSLFAPLPSLLTMHGQTNVKILIVIDRAFFSNYHHHSMNKVKTKW